MESSWWLDCKLGVRMLRKHPGLTLAGGVGIAVAVAIAVGGYSVVDRAFLVTSLPFAEGDRIVSLEIWDTAANRAERRIGHDFALWREQLRQVRELGAFRTSTANLIAPGMPSGTVQVAAINAAAFQVTRVQPLVGRYLLDGDERDGAPPVAVIGETLWRTRFGGDAAIVGRQITLGRVNYTVVGVMPEGYAFPVAQNVWIPLAASSAASEPLAGPELLAFGRLAAGATLDSAQAELSALTARQAADHPRRYELLRPRVLPYAFPFAGLHDAGDAGGLHLMQGLAGALLVLVCLNVAILVYSRTALRQGEIAVRTALGAGRGRIVAQLFTEALVLSVLASAAGVGIAAFTLREIGAALRRGSVSLPFWISFDLSPGAVLWAAVLGILAAAIIGILPALRATRGTVSDALRVVGSGASGLRLGATWTTLVVAQVAFAVALLPAAVYSVWESMRSALAPPGFAASECLTARLQIDHEPPGRLDELIRALEAQPAVSGVTFAAAMPGDEPAVRLEAENGDPAGHEVRFNRVGADFFQIFGVPLRTGRSLTAADATAPGQPVVANEALARSLFHGDALGRRVRIGHGPWREIVGVAADFPAAAGRGLADSTLHLYELAAPSTVEQPVLAVRLHHGNPVEFAGPLREIAARIAPEAELRDVLAMDEVLRREQWIRLLEGGVFAAVTLSVLLLSAAGIYALTSLTVSQRRKEIGIRTALGADPRRLLLGVFSRALRQLGLGAVLGMSGAAALEHALWGNLSLDNALRGLPVAAAILVGVGLLGVAGPARRSLRIAPSEALREE